MRGATLGVGVLVAACAAGPRIETRQGPGLQAATPAATATLAQDPRRLTFERLVFEPPRAEEHVPQAGGPKAFFAPNDELPLVDLALIVGMGARDAPSGKPGVVEMLERTLAVAGAGPRSPTQFAETAEGRAIEVHVSVGSDRTTLRVAALAADLPLAFELLADLARRPRYDAGRVEIERGRALEALRRRNDHPHAIASRELRSALYGPTSRWSSRPTQADLSGVTREDLLAHHRTFFTGGNSRLVAVGDIERGAFLKLLGTHFGDWGGAAPQRPDDDGAARPAGPLRRVAVKAGAQAVILAGQRWLPRHHADRYASDLLNYILGGGVFQSRLGEAIRSDRGLAYSVRSGVRRLDGDVGYFYVYAGTKPASQDEVLGLLRAVLDAAKEDARVSPAELARTKDAFLNSHVFNFDTTYDVAMQQAVLDHYGYPDDWLRTYPERLAAVSAEDIARLAKTRLTPGRFATIVVSPMPPAGEGWEPIDLSAALR